MARWAADERYVRLVQQHSAALMRLALLLTRDRQDAEDAVQDALISLAGVWPRVRPETAYAYARKAVVNQVISMQRKRRDITGDTVADRGADDARLLRHEDDRAFLHRVRNLPPQQRAVIVLRYYADLPDREIAEHLHCTVQTVRSQAHRALAKLRAGAMAEEES